VKSVGGVVRIRVVDQQHAAVVVAGDGQGRRLVRDLAHVFFCTSSAMSWRVARMPSLK
jgi:hypothetical protein